MSHFGNYYNNNANKNYLNSYIYEIKSLINSKNGSNLATLLSLEKFSTSDIRNSIPSNLQPNENIFSKLLDSPWDEVVKNHLLALQTLLNQKNNYPDAFQYHCSMVKALYQVLTQSKEENWMLPIVFVASTELRKLAICSDAILQKNKSNSKHNASIEEAAAQLMNLFRVTATDSRTSIELSKRKGMINIINQLFKIYFRINKLNLYKPLVNALDNANIMEHFTLSERVTYSYFTGMKSLYESDYRKADNLLNFAFENCHPKMLKNRRLILIFLIPVKMLYSGCMPTKQLLIDNQLLQFEQLCQAIKDGNLYQFDQAIEENSDFFYYYGIYFTLEKLKTLVYRNVFKKVVKIVNNHQIALSHFVDAIYYFQTNRNTVTIADDEKITCDEVHCLLANLIAENKLKGYISLQHQKLVISKTNAFPKLSSTH